MNVNVNVKVSVSVYSSVHMYDKLNAVFLLYEPTHTRYLVRQRFLLSCEVRMNGDEEKMMDGRIIFGNGG